MWRINICGTPNTVLNNCFFKKNSYTEIKFTYPQIHPFIIQQLLAYSELCEHYHNFRNFYHPQKETQHSLAFILPYNIPNLPSPRHHISTFCLSIGLLKLDISYKGNHTVLSFVTINVSGTRYFKSQICGTDNAMRSEKWKRPKKGGSISIYLSIYCKPGRHH